MDFATVLINGKQEHVTLGMTILVDKLEAKTGDVLVFDQVLVLCQDKNTVVGQPYVANIKVQAEVLEQLKGEKIYVQKYKQKVRYRRKTGFRPLLTKIKIISIGVKKEEKVQKAVSEKKPAKVSKVEKKTLKPKEKVKKTAKK